MRSRFSKLSSFNKRMTRIGRSAPATAVAGAALACLAALATVVAGSLLPSPTASPFGSAALAVERRAVPPAPAVEAGAAVLMDVASGRVLHAKEPDLPLPPASTTKILTALIVLENADLRDQVTVSAAAAAREGSSMYLRPGMTVTVEDLLYGLLLSSGNDAATALAEHVAGGEAAFAVMMNGRAAELGARNSRFLNASGLPAEGQVTTARDLALIAAAALRNPVFARMVSTPTHNLVMEGTESRTLHNNNRLLGQDGIDGVKTGYTSKALHTYVGSATRDGWQLVATILMDSKEGKWRDAGALLSWGFTAYRRVVLLGEGEAAVTVPVADGGRDRTPRVAKEGGLAVPLLAAAEGYGRLPLAAERRPLAIPVLVDGSESAYYETEAPAAVRVPVEEGERLGRLTVNVNGSPLFSRPLLAAVGVRESEPRRARSLTGRGGIVDAFLFILAQLGLLPDVEGIIAPADESP